MINSVQQHVLMLAGIGLLVLAGIELHSVLATQFSWMLIELVDHNKQSVLCSYL